MTIPVAAASTAAGTAGTAATAPYTPLASIPSIVKEARAASDAGVAKPLAWRKAQLRRLHDFLDVHAADIVDALRMDLGRHARETDFTEIMQVKNSIVIALEEIDDWVQPESVSSGLLTLALDRTEVRAYPRGLVLIIGTWNFPLVLTIRPLISSIAAGNVSVVKISELCPHFATVLLKHLPSFMDTSALKLVYGAVPESTLLLEQRYDMIFYTGNSAVGRIVLAAGVKHLTPVVLELGGKCPVIVDKDANIRSAAKRILWGKTINCGQICVAPDHIFVHRSVAQALYAEIPRAVAELLGENPETSDVYPRIVNQRHFDRIAKLLDRQLEVPGVELVYGGQRNRDKLFIGPTVFKGVTTDAKKHPLMESEIFGPLLPIIEYDDIEDVIQAINSRKEAPLALYPFSRNQAFIDHVFDNISSGSGVANDVVAQLAVESLPFGGVGESGMGCYHGKFGFDTFSHKRSILIHPSGFEAILNEPRYQLPGYKAGTLQHTLINVLIARKLNSESHLAIKHWLRKSFRTLNYFAIPLSLVVGLVIGLGIRRP